MRQSKTQKRLTGGIVAVVALALCLAVTTFALIYATVSVQNNLFGTGRVQINLNDGRPVIAENEFLFEPGMTVQKSFFVENTSSCDVYYKLYFENVGGGLAQVLQLTVSDGTGVLYSGTANELTEQLVPAANDVLKIGQRRELTVTFYFPSSAGNSAAGQSLLFNLCAKAVQTKNNPNKVF